MQKTLAYALEQSHTTHNKLTLKEYFSWIIQTTNTLFLLAHRIIYLQKRLFLVLCWYEYCSYCASFEAVQ